MRQYVAVIILTVLWVSVSAQVKMKKEAGGLLFTEDNENVLFYQSEPKNMNGEFERCNYIHPLWGLDGTVLTEDFPADHLHHRGIFWAWHQVWIGDKRIGDPWEIKDFDQNVTDIEFIAQKEGTAILKTSVDWKSTQWKKAGEKVPYLKENTIISIHPKKGNYRRIDFEIRLLALEEDLSIGGSEDVKGYSGFSIRMKLPDDILFTGPGGNIEPQNEAVQSPGYINISGSLLGGNKNGGVLILDNPENPGYPQSWIIRAKNSMQNAAYPGNTTIPISTQKPLVLKYSLLFYSGKMNDKKIQKIIVTDK